MRITEISVKHPVTTLMIFLAMVFIGVISLTKLSLELFPDVTFPSVVIITMAPGSGPQEVESRITKLIEESTSTLNGVKEITSSSQEGVSLVMVSLEWSINMDTIVPEIREKLAEIEDELPETTERSRIIRFNPEQLPTLVFNISTKTKGIDVRELVEKKLTPELEKIEGVATADVYGGRIKAVTVELALDALAGLNIPVTQVLGVFQGENINLPGGTLSLTDKHVVLRTLAEFKTLEDIGNVLVAYRDKVPIYLHDVAQIKLSHLPQAQKVRMGDGEGVQLAIRKQPGFNTVDVNRKVKERMTRLRANLPPSLVVEVDTDQSKSIIASIGSLGDAAWQGGILAIIILLLFLRNIRSTLIISITIPVSVITTFSLMNFAGITMNILSLLGITLGIGMFVDNAIVVLEANYRKLLGGASAAEAAIQGTEEVGLAIAASTLTTICVFVPLLFLEGIAGLLFRDLAYTISFALVLSLFMALSLIPVACSRLLKLPAVQKLAIGNKKTKKGAEDISLADVEVRTKYPLLNKIAAAIQQGLIRMDMLYERLLNRALDHSLVVIVSAVLLFVFSIGAVMLLGMEFIPEADESQFSVSLETRVGSPYAVTEEKIVQVENIIKAICSEELLSLSSNIGRAGDQLMSAERGSHMGAVSVTLVDSTLRQKSIWQIISLISQGIEEQVTDIKFRIKVKGISAMATMASGASETIVLEIVGDDLERMHQYASAVAAQIKAVQGTRDVKISFKTGKPEFQIKVKRQEAVSLGLSPREIAVAVRTAYNGTTVTAFKAENNDYDVVVILQETDRKKLEQISKLFFINSAGMRIPLENVADIVEDIGPLSIERKNRIRTIKVTGSLTGERALSQVMEDVRKNIAGLGMQPTGIELAYAGSEEQMKESFTGLFFTFLIAIVLVYMVMASQFESLLHPFIIMFSIPFAIIGLVLALLLTNTTFSIIAFMGGILLVGIVVNNAIILIDYMNHLQKKGVSLREAIVHGGKTRLKPIFMTTFTTIFGLLPTALGLGTGAELRAPIAKAVVGGLSTSTLVTLILIPVIYWLVESRLKKKRSKAI